MTAARLTIDLGALAHNYAALRREAAGAEVAPVVKADGYGLGAGPIARRLWNEGARSFFVARLSEAEALRATLGRLDATIYVLDGVTPEAPARLLAARLTPVINSLDEIERWQTAIGAARAPAALHIDTGMNRVGIDGGQVQEAATRLAAAATIDLVLVMSHLANAAEPGNTTNPDQLARFKAAGAAFPGVPASLAASAGAFLGPDYRFQTVRPGISLVGGGPRERPDARFRAVATLEAPVLQVRDLNPGDRVGYGSMFTAAQPMRIALLAAGYADGLLRRSYAKGFAWLNGARAPLVIVSMDMIAIDVSACGEVQPGDWAQLLGPDVLLDDIAEASETVAHECLTRLNARAERVYID
ncbi:alanine racemase [soil metagenome]